MILMIFNYVNNDDQGDDYRPSVRVIFLRVVCFVKDEEIDFINGDERMH